MAPENRTNFVGVNEDYSGILARLSERTKSKKQPSFNPKKHKDETRARIAMIFTIGFFSLMLIGLIGVPIYNSIFLPKGEAILSIKDTLLIISSVVGGPFGFVIGHYFKGSEDK